MATYAINGTEIDAKFSELLSTVENTTLREAMYRRLKRNSHLVTGVILTDENQKICLVQEAKGPWAGKWNLPIGHLEHDESLADSAKREAKEETGYDVKLISLSPPQNASGENVFRILYIGKVIGGSPKEREEGDTSAVNWFSVAEIENLYQNQKLRDAGVWQDILLYQGSAKLPLETIVETRYEE